MGEKERERIFEVAGTAGDILLRSGAEISRVDETMRRIACAYELENVSTFVLSYDFTGKKVAVFCTSGSSGVEDSQEKLRALLPGAEFRPGIRFDAAATVADVRAWAAEADIG